MEKGLDGLGDIDFSKSVGSLDLSKEPPIGVMEKGKFSSTWL